MILILRLFFIIVLVSTLCVTTWASKQTALWKEIQGDTFLHTNVLT